MLVEQNWLDISMNFLIGWMLERIQAIFFKYRIDEDNGQVVEENKSLNCLNSRTLVTVPEDKYVIVLRDDILSDMNEVGVSEDDDDIETMYISQKYGETNVNFSYTPSQSSSSNVTDGNGSLLDLYSTHDSEVESVSSYTVSRISSSIVTDPSESPSELSSDSTIEDEFFYLNNMRINFFIDFKDLNNKKSYPFKLCFRFIQGQLAEVFVNRKIFVPK